MNKTFPVIRFASGVEPEYKNKNHHEPKLADNGPRQIKLSPNHGKEETMITVVVHAFPDHTPAKLAFNNLLVDTDQMRKQDVTSLVASVPPFRHICSSTLTVPVYICFFNEEIVTSTWFVANFKYDRTDEELSSHNISMNSGLHMRDTSNSATTGYQNYYPVLDIVSRFSPQVPSYQHYSYQQRDPLSSYITYSGDSTPDIGPFNMADTTTAINKTDNSSATHTASYLAQPTTADQLLSPDTATCQTKKFQKKKAPYIPTMPISQYRPYPTITSRTNLDIMGDLDAISSHWTTEENNQCRRIVQFAREQDNQTIRCHFRPVSIQDTLSKDINVVSCIYWEEQKQSFITSVDCIYLLEALLNIRFSVEEKNRIRRNLEGFHPWTISKRKEETSKFFKLIMGFSKPKPRNIEKDIKVFPWKTLPYALKKIITKYTANEFRSGLDIQVAMVEHLHPSQHSKNTSDSPPDTNADPVVYQPSIYQLSYVSESQMREQKMDESTSSNALIRGLNNVMSQEQCINHSFLN